MKIETKQKIKEFYVKRRLEIIAGGLIVGGIIIASILKPEKVEIHDVTNIEVLPEWAKEWKQKCNNENLMYNNGLPVFADDTYCAIYSDALADGYSKQDALDEGFTIIERA